MFLIVKTKKIMNGIFTDLYNCLDVNTYENKLTELKERWLEIETRFTRNEPTDQFVKYFEKHKNEAIKFKLTKFARKRACLKRVYWQNIIEWQNHLVKEEIRSRNKKVKTASLIDAIETMKAWYLRMCINVCKAVYGEGPYILSPPYKQFVKGYEEWRESSK